MASRSFTFFATIIACCLALSLSNVLELNKGNFDQHVDGSSNVLVEFFAPWCGHCKNLAPEWKLAAETFQPTDGIKFAAVDATENSALADKYGVQGYPTIKFFPKGSTEAQDYDGGRTADTIVKWVNGKVGTSRRVKVAPSSVVTLTSENFDTLVSGAKAALVEFYAPWCGHCKQLAPKYEQVANIFAGDSEVLIAKVDATEEEELAQKFEVRGYPTIKFFPGGANALEDYQGGREVEDFVEFLNNRAGTQRNADGSLKSTAGRIAALDDAIKAASFEVTATLQQQLEELAKALSETEQAVAKIYMAVVKNILSKGKDYINTETARLTKLLAGGNLKAESKKNFQLRQNVLKAFTASSSSSSEEL